MNDMTTKYANTLIALIEGGIQKDAVITTVSQLGAKTLQSDNSVLHSLDILANNKLIQYVESCKNISAIVSKKGFQVYDHLNSINQLLTQN